MFEIEPAGSAKAHRSDTGIGSEFFFIIGMPAHFVVPIAIKIEQDAVEFGGVEQLFDAVFDGKQGGCPCQWGVHHAAIGIRAVWIAIPCHQARCGVHFAKQFDVVLLPSDVVFERIKQGILRLDVEDVFVVL